MKKIIFTLLLLITLCGGVWCQEPARFTPEQQAIIDLSNQKWIWMAEKNIDQLRELFHKSSQFVHMGGYWGKEEELRTNYRVQVDTAINSSNTRGKIHLNSVVGGHDVRFPFIVTEVYVISDGRWQLSSLVFTKTIGE